MTTIRVKCSPEHARRLAERMSIAGEFEVAAALAILADDVEGYTRALSEHHNTANLSANVVREGFGGECPVCAKARSAA